MDYESSQADYGYAVTSAESPRRAIDRVLEAEFLSGIQDWTLDELHTHKQECQELENSVSFARRLAQGRLEILRAERKRRNEGGSIADLVAALPEILGGDSGRAPAATTRYPSTLAPDLEHDWVRGLEPSITDTSLIELPDLADDELDQRIAHIETFEGEVSQQRSALHRVIDQLDQAIAEQVSNA